MMHYCNEQKHEETKVTRCHMIIQHTSTVMFIAYNAFMYEIRVRRDGLYDIGRYK